LNALTLGILAYLALQLAFGLYAARGVRSAQDFLLAGRSLSPLLASVSIFATWFGAETCLGAAGSAYREGLHAGSAEPFAYGLCLILMGLVFAIPLHRAGLSTLADLFRRRFGERVERLAAVLMIPTSLLWAAAQLRGFAHVLDSASGWGLATCLLVGGAVVIAYSFGGGLRADVVTDLVQGMALVLGLAVLLVWVLWGPLEDQWQLGALRADAAQAPGPRGWELVETWAIPIGGSVLAQELVARVLASRSPQVARNASLMGGGLYLLVGLIPLFLGLVGAQLLPGLEDPEAVLPGLAAAHLPVWAYVLFAGALISAILSTVDSTLLVCCSLWAHNLRPRARDEKSELQSARRSLLVFGAIALLLAASAEGVFALVEEASALGSAGILCGRNSWPVHPLGRGPQCSLEPEPGPRRVSGGQMGRAADPIPSVPGSGRAGVCAGVRAAIGKEVAPGPLTRAAGKGIFLAPLPQGPRTWHGSQPTCPRAG